MGCYSMLNLKEEVNQVRAAENGGYVSDLRKKRKGYYNLVTNPKLVCIIITTCICSCLLFFTSLCRGTFRKRQNCGKDLF